MSHLRVCLLACLILSVVLADSTENNHEKEVKTLGLKSTQLSLPEKFLKFLKPSEKTFEKNVSSRFSHVMNKLKDKIHLIAPGTRWCGDGNMAKDKNDLGCLKETDACCREHDMCKNSISPGEKQLNLINNGIFTRSACCCDDKFYKCLKSVKNPFERPISESIGTTYFDILRPQCFYCSSPTTKCKVDDGIECKDCCNKYEWKNNHKFKCG